MRAPQQSSRAPRVRTRQGHQWGASGGRHLGRVSRRNRRVAFSTLPILNACVAWPPRTFPLRVFHAEQMQDGKMPSACLPRCRKLEPRGRALGSHSGCPNWIRTRTHPDRVFAILCFQKEIGSTRLRKRKGKRPAGNKKEPPPFLYKTSYHERNERTLSPRPPLACEMCIRTTRGGTLSRPNCRVE